MEDSSRPSEPHLPDAVSVECRLASAHGLDSCPIFSLSFPAPSLSCSVADDSMDHPQLWEGQAVRAYLEKSRCRLDEIQKQQLLVSSRIFEQRALQEEARWRREHLRR